MKKSGSKSAIIVVVLAVSAILSVLLTACDNQQHSHTLIRIERKEATCTEDGNIEYWSCSECGKNFSDSEGVTETDNVSIPAGHTLTHHEKIDAGCTKDGNIEYWSCSVCGKNFSDGEATSEITEVVIPSKGGHVFAEGVCTVCGAPAPSENLRFTLSASGEFYTLTNAGLCSDTHVVIPEIYNGKPVKAIGIRTYWSNKVTKITIPDSVVYIGDYAFRNCSLLTSISLPDSVTEIGSYAFQNCSSLTSISLPDSLTEIGSNAFLDCEALVYNEYSDGFYLGNENNPYLMLISTKPVNVDVFRINENTEIIYECAFLRCSFKNINIPSNVRTITQNAFVDCSSLEKVTFSENSKLTVIGKEAFSGCELKSIDIPDSVTKIDDYAFNGCHSLKNVNFSSGSQLTHIGENAFEYCYQLTGITFPDTLTNIDIQAFHKCTSLTSLTFGANSQLTEIGSSAFYNCTSLKEITLPDKLEYIGSSAFNGCSALENLNFSSNIRLHTIGVSVFGNCTSLNYAEYDNAYYIGSDDYPFMILAYAKSNDITSCRIHSSTRFISDSAFDKRSSLKEVTFEGNSQLLIIGSNAFFGCTSISEITIPASVTHIYNYAFSRCTSLEKIVMPGPVNIGHSAFSVCSSLSEVIFPEAVDIGQSAFSECTSLTSLTLPSSLQTIDDYAFDNCSALTIYCEPESKPSGWSDDLSSLFSFSTPVVWNCKNNDVATDGYIYTIAGGIRYALRDGEAIVKQQPSYIRNEIKIPESVVYKNETYTVTGIDDYAFSKCDSITNIEIPDSLTTLGDFAFSGCEGLVLTEYGNALYLGNEDNPYIVLIKAKSKDITSCSVHANTKFIYNSAFYDCASLNGISVPDGVISIGEKAFENCRSLADVTFGINSRLTRIGKNAFAYCESLTDFTIPENVTLIVRHAFYDCDSLTNVTFINTEGWVRYTSPDWIDSATPIASNDLADKNTAAEYITSRYYNDYWERR